MDHFICVYQVVATFPAGDVDESIGDTNSVECLEFSPKLV